MGIEIQMSGTPRSAENRQAKRYRYRGAVTVRRLESDPSFSGLILELSTTGCLLRLPDISEFEVGSVVDIAVNSRAVAFRALGSVRHRSHTRSLLGVAFVNLSRRGQSELLDLIADLEATEKAGDSGVHEITVFKYDGPKSR
jgi:c-di-GMP-binding flagellar brake protein YcgR